MTLLAMLVLLEGRPLCSLFTSIHRLLTSDLQLELLNLIKAPYQTVFEILFDVGGDDFDIVVRVVDLAVVQFVLDEVRQFLVVVLAVGGVRRALSFEEGPVEFCLEFESS